MSKERSPRAVCSTTIGTSGIGPPFRGWTAPLTLSRRALQRAKRTRFMAPEGVDQELPAVATAAQDRDREGGSLIAGAGAAAETHRPALPAQRHLAERDEPRRVEADLRTRGGQLGENLANALPARDLGAVGGEQTGFGREA